MGLQVSATLVPDLAVVSGVAALTSTLARALGQPSILGYLFAGLLVGPYLPVPLFADPHRIEALAELGVVLVMFAVGLEFRVSRLLQVLPLSGFTALVQIATMMWAGFSLGAALGWGTVGASFLGATLAISSTMVVTGLFGQRPVDEDVRGHVLGVLVVQDVVAIGLIAAMTALAGGQDLEPGQLALLVARLLGVLVALLGVGMLVVPRLVRVVLPHGDEAVAVLATGLAFGVALLASKLGYSAALGSFVAGILVAESGAGRVVEHAIAPLRAVFAAIFFVSIGMSVDPLLAWRHLPLSALVVAVIILGQLFSVTAGSLLSGLPLRRAMLSGLALGQIGELSFILAGIGAQAGVAPEALLPTLVTVATLTAFTTPQLLARGDALVSRVDHHIPPRVSHLLAVYQSFLDRLRSSGGSQAGLRAALSALALDWLGLMVLAASALSLQEAISGRLEAWLGLPPRVAQLLGDASALLLAVPLLVGLVRNARLVASAAGHALGEMGPTPAPRRALEALAQLAILMGVGLPALALLRPLMRGPWAEPLLIGALLGALLLVRRNLDRMEGDFRSGAEALAHRLAAHAQSGPEHVADPKLLPGLDDALALRLGEGDHAVGRTLAQLDLRARTGATVVAIRKAGAEVVLPTGHEGLEAGDVLGLVGSAEATERARVELTRGPAAA